VHYPLFATAARLLARIDWLDRQTTFGSAFIAVSATKPSSMGGEENQQDASEQSKNPANPSS